MAVFATLGAGLLFAADGLADTGAGGASPGFSWKTPPKPAQPAPAPIAIPMPLPPPPAHVVRPPTPAPPPVASDAPPNRAPPPEAPPEAPPAPNGGAPLSTDQLAKLYQGLSGTSRETLENMIKTQGIEGLSKMNEGDARKSFGGMPSTVRDEIQAKWDGLSDEQRTALKKLKPDDIKNMATTQAKEIVQASVAPILKPVESVVASTEAAVDKTKSVLKRSRDYVQKLISKMTGKSEEPEQAAE